MTKLIFLDIDGVLVLQRSIRAKNEYVFDQESVHNLLDIIEAAGETTRIIITSSWRENRELTDLRKHFEWNGFPGELIIDTTQIFGRRDKEIQAYLDTYGPLESFVIIDDNEHDDLQCLEPFLVETTFKTGIDNKTKAEAIRILNG